MAAVAVAEAAAEVAPDRRAALRRRICILKAANLHREQALEIGKTAPTFPTRITHRYLSEACPLTGTTVMKCHEH